MRHLLRRAAYSLLSHSTLQRLYVARKLVRRWRYRARELAGTRRVTEAELGALFHALGIRQGDTLMVHSSLSRIGSVDGGAETILAVLFEAIGPEGTLVMPAYPTMGSMVDHFGSDPLFDVAADPSRMGKLTECLRLVPEARRSLHPSHSVVAVGPRAEELVRDHHRCRSPFGAESPFQRLIELDGKILCLGVELAYISSLHVPEERFAAFPLAVYLEQPASARVRDHAGNERVVVTLVHDPDVSATRIEKNPPLLAFLKAELRRRGILYEQPLGRATGTLVGARALELALEELAAGGVTIYSRVDP